MNLSVVIKCSDDEKIWRCIGSIDEKVEIVVSLTPNIEIQEKLNKLKIKYVLVPKGNIALTANAGINIASKSKVIIMDSDAYFESGAIKIINHFLNTNSVVKPRIIWHDNGTKLGKIIASERDYFNRHQLVAYTPGLGIRKDVINKIGGSVFNNFVRWAEDAELNWRIKESKITIFPVDNAIIHHDPTTFNHELFSAFYIGVGKRLSVEHAGRIPDEDFLELIKKVINLKIFFDFVHFISIGGIDYLCFMLLWKASYYLGYYTQKYTKKFTPTKKLMSVI